MKYFAVIGDPVSQSFSPDLFKWLFKKFMIEADYQKIKVEKINLAQFLKNMRKNNIYGFNVTLPHKQNIIKYLDSIDITAKEINSVNVVHNINGKLAGYNSDWSGFSMSLGKNSVYVKDKEIILLGAGGSARSIIYCLNNLGANHIFVLHRGNKDKKMFEKFNVTLADVCDAEKIIKNNSIVINSTPVGMKTDQTPIDYGLIHKNQILIDVIYSPYQTSFLKFGAGIGAQTINGLDMFIYQALISFNLWFGDQYVKQLHFNDIKKFLLKIIK